jgi:hypothetical protein
MVRVLRKLPDFQNSKCSLRKLIESRGHILMISPKCHPELAGNGIEYAWGFSSSLFRRTNFPNGLSLEQKVEAALVKEHLTMERIWKFERKARDYMSMYSLIENIEEEKKDTFEKIESYRELVKDKRCHRIVVWKEDIL